LAGVARQARKLIGGQLDGYRRQFKAATKLGDEDFDALLSDAARQDLPSPGGGAAPSAQKGGEKTGGGAPSTPTPRGRDAVKKGGLDVTGEEYNKLPPGAAYTVPGDPTVRYKLH